MAEPVTRRTERPLAATEVASRPAWDDAIDALGGGLLQDWRWGEFKSRHGWSAERLLLVAGDEPIAAAQVLFRRVGPLSVAYVPRGPATAALDTDAATALTAALDRLARRRRAAMLFLEPDRPVPLSSGGSLQWRPSEAQFQPLRTIKVPIDRSDDDLLAAMKPKTRYNVRLAERRGVCVRRASPGEIDRVYPLFEETAARDEFGIHSVEYYRDMLEVFGEDACLLIAEFEAMPAAAIIVVRHGDEAIYLHGASAAALQRHMPAYLIQFEAMRWARDAGCSCYDLWGIPPDDTPPAQVGEGDRQVNVRDGLWGVYRFKQGFGGDVVAYPGVFERVYLGPLVRLWRRFRPGVA